MSNQTWDVIIIGAGLAGLTASVYLARSGKRVAVLERGQIGGRASTKEISGSFYNLGPHALYKQGKGLKILRELGIRPDTVELKPGGTLVIDGQLYDLPASTWSLLKTGAMSLKEKKEFALLMTKLAKIETPNIEQITLQEWAEQHIETVKVRKLLYMFCRLSSYMDAPDQASAGVLIRRLQLSLQGTLYIHGGWQTIVEAIKQKALHAGVTFFEKARATSIQGTRPQMTVTVEQDGQFMEQKGKFVISTLGPAETHSILDPAIRKEYEWLPTEAHPVRAACLDLTLKRSSNPDIHFALDLNQPLYFSNHSHNARLTRSVEHQVVHVMKYLRAETEAEDHRQELENFVAYLHPDWQSRLVHQRYLPHVTVAHRLPAAGQQTNVQSSENGTGLYFAGDWLTTDVLLADAAILTAKRTALTILKQEIQALSV